MCVCVWGGGGGGLCNTADYLTSQCYFHCQAVRCLIRYEKQKRKKGCKNTATLYISPPLAYHRLTVHQAGV